MTSTGSNDHDEQHNEQKDADDHEMRDETWSYTRRSFSLALQGLFLAFWGLVQIVFLLIDQYLPRDVLAQATFFTILALEAVTTLAFTAMTTYRDIVIYAIRARTDIKLAGLAAHRRIEAAERHHVTPLEQPGQPKELNQPKE